MHILDLAVILQIQIFTLFTKYTFPNLVCCRLIPAAVSTCANWIGVQLRSTAGKPLFQFLMNDGGGE
ncbi:hypothetical protein NXX35_13545 [Bacteroides xylanisolvens]|nr:hypothetical protein NXX35_13545 [Bacteroides xylanisolvens]